MSLLLPNDIDKALDEGFEDAMSVKVDIPAALNDDIEDKNDDKQRYQYEDHVVRTKKTIPPPC